MQELLSQGLQQTLYSLELIGWNTRIRIKIMKKNIAIYGVILTICGAFGLSLIAGMNNPTDVSSIEADITVPDGRVGTNETDIATNAGDISTNATDIATKITKPTTSSSGDILEYDGANWQAVANSGGTSGLTSNKIVTITNGTSSADIQAQIDAQPKILNGYTLDFQFGAETITLTNTLTFQYFNGGKFRILGEDTTSTTNTAQTTIIDGSSFSGNCIAIKGSTEWSIRNLKIMYDSTSANRNGLNVNMADGVVSYNWFVGEASAAGDGTGAYLQMSRVWAIKNLVTYGEYGFFVYNGSSVFCNDNDDTANAPKYGIGCRSSSVYQGGVQPTGSTADGLEVDGGQIFPDV